MTAVRPARPEDLPAVAALERACFSDPWPEAVFSRLPGSLLVAEEDGSVLGYLVLSSVLDEGSVDNVAVHPDHRRRGIADALLAAAAERARQMRLSFITLEVRASNAPAIALYEKHGYALVGRRKNYYQKPREDALLLTKVLETC